MSERETACSPIVWCVGGTDSSGGAGVTRDLATLADLDVHGCAIITLVSAQSHSAMISSKAMQTSLINEQWQVLAAEALPLCIKIGAIANDGQANILSTRIEMLKNPRPFIVWDPVLFSSSKGPLSNLNKDAIKQLLSVVDLVTPNTHELTSLAGIFIDSGFDNEREIKSEIKSNSDVRHAAHTLINSGVKGVLVKGGHALWQPDATDFYFTESEETAFSQPRVHRSDLRGTGCMQASALTAFVAKGYSINDALTLANAYVKNVRDISSSSDTQSLPTPIRQSVPHVPKLVGFPVNRDAFPTVSFIKHGPFTPDDGCQTDSDVFDKHHHERHNKPFLPLSQTKRGIYPVVDSADWIETLLPTGVETIQLRIKEEISPWDQKRISNEIQRAVALTKGTSCQLFINDHWQLAIEHGAFGVHLGQEDLFTADIDAIRNAGLRLGVSTHGYAEIQRVKSLAPSYIALGHIFATKTKDMPSQPQGIDRLKRYVELCGDIPTVAIGGINKNRCKAVADTGVTHIAVVTAITEAHCPTTAYYHLGKEAGLAE
ncbi:thiamine phosphate synthase [Alteromonas sp. BMJM2]|uniref:thiamine phosphate synthase n=1 Tax=Alteromonas sp. BMJM2 TaxID=2954241 RepID=UPI0022B4A413|nr:thiamine phosphate synthase [Alteromonas sp. BMJM2]